MLLQSFDTLRGESTDAPEDVKPIRRRFNRVRRRREVAPASNRLNELLSVVIGLKEYVADAGALIVAARVPGVRQHRPIRCFPSDAS